MKERAIACMGQILANMGDILNNELIVCLPIFLERLRNEVTRLSAVKALISIAASPLRIDLTPILVSARTALLQCSRAIVWTNPIPSIAHSDHRPIRFNRWDRFCAKTNVH